MEKPTPIDRGDIYVYDGFGWLVGFEVEEGVEREREKGEKPYSHSL